KGATMRPEPDLTAGLTVPELSRLLRVGCDKLRHWIKTGQIGAVNVAGARSARPRFVVLPHHLAEWERRRGACVPAKPARRRRRVGPIDVCPEAASSAETTRIQKGGAS